MKVQHFERKIIYLCVVKYRDRNERRKQPVEKVVRYFYRVVSLFQNIEYENSCCNSNFALEIS